MRLIQVQTCPIWEEANGSRRPGLEFEPDHPPVVGWCVVLVLEIGGVVRRLLAVS